MAKLYTVTVTLDNSVPPNFAFSPDPVVDPGKATISWVQGSSNFDFAALAFDHPNPFQNVVVSATGITAVDDNQRPEKHKYSVLVKVNHVYYSSEGGLTGGGGPTIRNN
jgi:hypothetical protein